MFGKLPTILFYFLSSIGGPILLIVLPISIITSFLDSFQDSEIPTLRVLISSFSPSWGELSFGSTSEYCFTRLELHEVKNAAGTLVVPFWPSAHYWQLIMHKYGNYIVAHAIRAGEEVLTQGNKKKHNSLLGSPQFTGFIIALRMEFTEF